MARGYVSDFVADDRRELILVLRSLENSGHDADLAARHGESIDRVRLEDRHFPVEVAIVRRQFHYDRLRYTMNVVDLRPVRFERHVRLHLRELAGSLDRQFLVVLENHLRASGRGSRTRNTGKGDQCQGNQ